MYEISDNTGNESNFMDLTVSPTINNNISPKILDRPPRNFGKVGDLRSVQELPEKYRCVFEFPFFNIIQSNVLDDVLYSDVSVVISAPTGSGKTVVFELAIIKLLMNFEENNFSGPFNIVYVAPLKSLCHERLSEWHIKFSKIGISCIVCTGDNENMDIRCLKNYNIIITTPEKWDSVTRNSKDHDILHNVKLFLIDEVHLLNEESRGPNLEVTVSRMKILKNQDSMRFLAVSATIPNIEDIAKWLGGIESAVYFKIGEDLRPVKLNKIVLGYPYAENSSPFKFELNLNYKLQNILLQYSEGKPTLIFCSTRKSVETTAIFLSQNLSLHLQPSHELALDEAAKSVSSTALAGALRRGVGAHHAGLSPEEKRATEQAFREGHLPILLSTATLAAGVNLPAHTVVLKGTMQYVGCGFQEYPESTILQMIGRAGRPQFDTKANVVIMTTLQQKKKYEKMLGGTELIESNLHRHLTEHLNAEIALGTITDIAIALEWLRYTFLYIRVLKNPKHYNIPVNFTKAQIEKRLQDWCQIEINALHKHGMLQIDQIDGFSVTPTNSGILMANYYLAFNTMKIFSEIKGTETLSELLALICKCPEFSESYLRVNDKKTLNLLNKNKYQETIRFPMKGTIRTTPMKIYCLIQAIFGCIRIQNPALYQESIKIMRIGERIAKCLVTFLLPKPKFFSALLNALILNQCFNAQLWENSSYVVRQFPKIGPVLSSMLVSAGKTDFKTILDTSPRDIERIINRSPPMGNDILDAVLHLPYYKVNLESSDIDKYTLKINITLLNSEDITKKCTIGQNSYMNLLVGDSENNILCYKKINHLSMANKKNYVEFINLILTTDHNIKVYLISENWVGIDCKENYNIIIKNDEIVPKNINFPTSTNKKIPTSFSPKTTELKTTKKQVTTIDKYFKNIKKPENKNTISENNINSIQNTVFEISDSEDTNLNNVSHFEHENFEISSENNLKNLETTHDKEKNIKFLKPTSTKTSNTVQSDFENFQNLAQNSQQEFENFGQDINFERPNNKTYKNNLFDTYDKLVSNLPDRDKKLTKTKPNIEWSDLETFRQHLNNKFSQNSQQNFENSKHITNSNEEFENQNFESSLDNIVSTVQNKNLKLLIPTSTKTSNMIQPNFEISSQNLAQNYSQNSQKKIENFGLDINVKNTNNKICKNKLFDTYDKLVSKLPDRNKKLTIIEPKSNTEWTDLETFRKHLDKKFSQNSQQNLENSFVNKVGKKIENNIKIKTMLKKFEFNSKNKIEQKKPIIKNKIKDPKIPNTQISFTQNYSQNTCSQNQSKITNEELEKFKRFIQTRKESEKNNSQNNSDIYPLEYCTAVYTQNFENSPKNFENTENSFQNSDNFQNIDNSFQNTDNCFENKQDSTFEIINISENNFDEPENKNEQEKPKFFKNFREYVQHGIDELKKTTLVNEYFNYDFGFQEFLMGPLDEPDSPSDISVTENNLNKTNFNNEIQDFTFEVPEIDKFQSINETTENSFTSPENKISDITFLPLTSENFENEEFNKNDLNFSPELLEYKNPEISLTPLDPENVDISFSRSGNIFTKGKNPENQNSESSEECSEKFTNKVENRLKIIDQYFSGMEKNISSPEIPAKRQKLDNVFVKKNNNLVRKPGSPITVFDKILKKYEYKNPIIFENKREYDMDSQSTEIVKKTYSYSITIYEKNTKTCSKNYEKQPPFSRF